MTTEALTAILRDILGTQTLCPERDGRFQYKLYADYNDSLSHDQLLAISSAPHKNDAFYDLLADYEDECRWDAQQSLKQAIRQAWPASIDDTEDFDALEDHIDDILMDLVDFTLDYDHYRQTPVHVNIMMNTGDGNYDFTLNNWLDVRTGPIHPRSALLWLCRQQGYGKRDINTALKMSERPDSPFLATVVDECANVCTSMNALTFLVRMTVGDFMNWMDDGGDITVSADTTCGLYDPWNGSGSLLGIQLEHPVRIPRRYVEPHVDGARGCSIDSIYYPVSTIWGDTVIDWHPPRKKVTR